MSTLATVTESYRAFNQQRYAPFVKGILGFGLIALLPQITAAEFFGIRLSEWLSLKVLVVTLVYAFTAQAWNIMSGYTGQFSFGHAAFFGIGAYATQKLLVGTGVNPWIGMLVGAMLAALYGLIIGFLTFRYDLRGHYFALATLAFAELMRQIVLNMGELNGANGFYKPFPRDYGTDYGIMAFQFQGDLPYFYVILAFLVIVTAVSWLIRNTWVGLYFFAIREDEQAASSIGVPAYRYKMIGVAVSAFFTAWGGAFWSMYFNTIRPDTVFALFKNVDILLPAVVGGPGTLLGPIVGAFVVTPISEIARTTFTSLPGLDQGIYGIFLVLIVLYSPEGVIRWPRQIRKLLRKYTDTDASGGD